MIVYFCIGFLWQGFGSRGLQGGFCEKLLDIFLVFDRANAKVGGPALAKAEPISNCVSASGITEITEQERLGWGSLIHSSSLRRVTSTCKGISPATPRSEEKEGFLTPVQTPPCNPGKTIVEQVDA